MADESDDKLNAVAATEEPKPEVNEEFIFRLKDQPTIKVELRNGDIKEFASDLAAMKLLEAGIGTKEMLGDSLEATKKVLEIVEACVGEPVGLAMSWAIVNQAGALVRKYAKKSAATPDSDTTTESGEPNTSEPAP